MLVLISPAKTLDLTPLDGALPHTQPVLLDEAEKLVRTARNLSGTKLQKLMGISRSLALLNRERFQQFSTPFTPDNAKQAALAFAGDTYIGLNANTLSPDDLTWAQDHLGILSGLYGLLRPLDLMQPYRLEMGIQLSTRRGKSLYEFWGERITKRANALTEAHADRTVVNLASMEYIRAIRGAKLAGPMVTPVFKEVKGAEAKVISFVAKRARGAMARWIIEQRLEEPEALKGYAQDDYTWRPELSTDVEWVFTRPSRTMAA